MIATVDLSRWHDGGAAADAVAAEVDESLLQVGFILVTGHGVDKGLTSAVRQASRDFFAQPDDVKRRYSVPVGGHGWIGPGSEANGYAEGTETPPDLKESYSLGAETATGDPAVDRIWFAPNVWPSEVPHLHALVTEYTAAMRRLSDDLLALFAHALSLPANPWALLANHPTWTMNINHYPPVSVVGEPEPGQFRIGPHTDFGTVAVLAREPGAVGLQVYSEADGWEDAHLLLRGKPRRAGHAAGLSDREDQRVGARHVIGLRQGTSRRHHHRLAAPRPRHPPRNGRPVR